MHKQPDHRHRVPKPQAERLQPCPQAVQVSHTAARSVSQGDTTRHSKLERERASPRSWRKVWKLGRSAVAEEHTFSRMANCGQHKLCQHFASASSNILAIGASRLPASLQEAGEHNQEHRCSHSSMGEGPLGIRNNGVELAMRMATHHEATTRILLASQSRAERANPLSSIAAALWKAASPVHL